MAADPVLSGPQQCDGALILSSEQEYSCVCVRACVCVRERESVRVCALLVLLIKHSIVTILNRSDYRSSVSG